VSVPDRSSVSLEFEGLEEAKVRFGTDGECGAEGNMACRDSSTHSIRSMLRGSRSARCSFRVDYGFNGPEEIVYRTQGPWLRACGCAAQSPLRLCRIPVNIIRPLVPRVEDVPAQLDRGVG